VGADRHEDEALVASVRAGDDRAFEQLYLRYQRRISAYIFGMVHDHQRAEDITQDVFMSALRRMRATDQRIIFKPWVYEIAKNACIDAFRRSRRAEEVSYDADESGEQLHLVSNGLTPDAAVDSRMSIDHLRGAFVGLSEAHHQILVMRELEGLSYREIGERMGMSRPSVESTLFRARRRLSEEYEELVSGDRCQQIQGIIAGAADGHVGTRDERKLGRHVSHCQPCRRAAFVAGFDPDALVPKRTVREKLAGWLPLPAFLKRFLLFGGGDRSAMLAQYADSTGGGWMKIAAAAGTLALAGFGAHTVTSTGKDVHGSGAAPGASAPARSSAPAGHGAAAQHVVAGSGAQHGSNPSGAGQQSSGGSGSSSGGSASSSSGSSSSAPSGSTSTTSSGGGSGPVRDATKPVTDAVGTTTTSVKVPPVQVPTVQVPKVQVPTVQVPTVPNAPPVVKKVVTTANGAVSGATGAVNNTVGGATDTVNKAAGQATGAVNNTVGGATGAVGGAVSNTGKAVDNTTKAAGDTVKGATGGVGNILGG
jgi:RNA polymerase sigma factor (sigma-70 family)